MHAKLKVKKVRLSRLCKINFTHHFFLALNARCMLVIIHLGYWDVIFFNGKYQDSRVRFSSRSENKDDRSVWIRMTEAYLTSPKIGIWPNLKESKCSMSSTSKSVFFGPIQKQRCMTTLVSDWPRDFQLLLFNRLPNGIWRNLTFMKQVFNVLYQVSGFFSGGWAWGWPEFAENKYVQVVNFTACRPKLCGSLQGFAFFHIIDFFLWT